MKFIESKFHQRNFFNHYLEDIIDPNDDFVKISKKIDGDSLEESFF